MIYAYRHMITYVCVYIMHARIFGHYVLNAYLSDFCIPFHPRYEAASELTERLCNLVTEEAVDV